MLKQKWMFILGERTRERARERKRERERLSTGQKEDCSNHFEAKSPQLPNQVENMPPLFTQ
jgi:hypothetical protein